MLVVSFKMFVCLNGFFTALQHNMTISGRTCTELGNEGSLLVPNLKKIIKSVNGPCEQRDGLGLVMNDDSQCLLRRLRWKQTRSNFS
jgi:hypothetical protein